MLAEISSTIESLAVMSAGRRCLSIGGITLSLHADTENGFLLDLQSADFEIGPQCADIEITVEWSERLRPWRAERDFDSGSLWALFREPQEFIFDFTSLSVSEHPYKRIRADRSFREVQLILSREALGRYAPVAPLEYPADELLVTNHLASGLGVEVHGCGLIDTESGGHLFLGHSGAGKSTTTNLWKSWRNVQVLSDDRIILRMHRGEVWMYGTPWHGEAAFASPARAKLKRIFILQHGSKNEIEAVSGAQLIGELFARCFPPFHSAAGIQNTVEFLQCVSQTVPCYEFRFVPDLTAVEFVVGFHDLGFHDLGFND
jgi:hypothetical protein